mmetsp:Transcript_51250/g.116717  ORF Transcript_51250/g.116717 Transcript_51250/m.116717 type:complete len:417 (-) Transcript_51250:3697-4947(-)
MSIVLRSPPSSRGFNSCLLMTSRGMGTEENGMGLLLRGHVLLQVLRGRQLPGLDVVCADLLKVHGQYAPEALEAVAPIAENPLGDTRSGESHVGVEHAAQLLGLQGQHLRHQLVAPRQLDHLPVAILLEVTLWIKDPRDTATHTRSEIGPGLAQDHHASPGHVLATVVADTLHDHPGPGVPDSETLGCNPAEESQAAGGSVHADVANNDVLLSVERGIARGIHDDCTSRQPLASIIVGITLELQHHTLSQESSHGIPAAALHPHVHQARWQRVSPPPLGELGGQQRAHSPVVVADVVVVHDARVSKTERDIGGVHQIAIDQPLEHWEMLLGVQLAVLNLPNLAGVRHAVRWHQNGQHLQLWRASGFEALVILQSLRVTNHLVHRTETQLGHDGAALLGDQHQVVHHVLGLPSKLLA